MNDITSNTDRKLASIQRISEVRSIPDADRIAHYKVNGWWVVDQKGKYEVDDLVIYCEIDSFIPTEIAPFLSRGKEPREFNGIKGERLRTIKLKKHVSQGLLLPLDTVEIADSSVGTDLTDLLQIQKWEKPIPLQLAGQMRGNFPPFLRKTDQERVQNISTSKLEKWVFSKLQFQVTEKLDGSSMTIYYNNGEWGVCSRNVDLKLDQDSNYFVDMFNSLEPQRQYLLDNFSLLGNFAVQGELVGGSIQGNQYKIEGFKFFVFDIFSINEQRYLNPELVHMIATEAGFDHVPIIEPCTALPTYSIDSLLDLAEGQSALNNSTREGLVYKSFDRSTSFKTISNKWLLKYD